MASLDLHAFGTAAHAVIRLLLVGHNTSVRTDDLQGKGVKHE